MMHIVKLTIFVFIGLCVGCNLFVSDEIAGLKRDKATLIKNEKRLESKLAAAHTRIEKLTNMIKDRSKSLL